ncbi:hypothetical protein E2C01_100501 [Portunus trituberculatus]|uniref:Uncharacterized protein n=1 Tax=Portunus trituberculatus TaxID=210409 RepID=A0A5B7K876_PORTR|nr:hypothetical protein [Portunus trituberculatus]
MQCLAVGDVCRVWEDVTLEVKPCHKALVVLEWSWRRHGGHPLQLLHLNLKHRQEVRERRDGEVERVMKKNGKENCKVGQ